MHFQKKLKRVIPGNHKQHSTCWNKNKTVSRDSLETTALVLELCLNMCLLFVKMSESFCSLAAFLPSASLQSFQFIFVKRKEKRDAQADEGRNSRENKTEKREREREIERKRQEREKEKKGEREWMRERKRGETESTNYFSSYFNICSFLVYFRIHPGHF